MAVSSAGVCLPRRAEIEQHRGAVVADVDVAGLDVAMQVAGLVHHFQAVEQRRDERRRSAPRRAAGACLSQSGSGVALDELHHHVGGAVGLEEAHHAHDVRDGGTRRACATRRGSAAAPVEVSAVVGEFGAIDWSAPRSRDVAGQVLLDRHLQVEVGCRWRGKSGRSRRRRAAFDAVLVQRVARGEGVSAVTCCRAYHLCRSALIAFSRLRRMRLNDLAEQRTSSLPLSGSSGTSKSPLEILSAAADMRRIGLHDQHDSITFSTTNSTDEHRGERAHEGDERAVGVADRQRPSAPTRSARRSPRSASSRSRCSRRRA